jgi:hypothetical protein
MNNKPSKEISRRDAIKILAAVVGATTLANIPDKWSKPGMEVGVLPAHAQTSLSHTLAAGADDPAVNDCWPTLLSTVTITPKTSGIPMHYVITQTGTAVIDPLIPLIGTVLTDGSGVASLSITFVTPFDSLAGNIVTVTWTFENASDGIGSDAQVFTSIAAC